MYYPTSFLRPLKRCRHPGLQIVLSGSQRAVSRLDPSLSASVQATMWGHFSWAWLPGHDVDDTLFGQLWKLITQGTHAEVYCWHAYRLLCKAGLYKLLNAGTLSLPALNPHPGDWRKASLVHEDPPTIITVEMAYQRTFTVIDLANYGVTHDQARDIAPDDDLAAAVKVITTLTEYSRASKTAGLKATAASTGFASWRRHFYSPVVAHECAPARQLERDSYYAGRCEALRIGRLPGHVYHLDVRSMYLSLGACFNFPNRLQDYNECPSPNIVDDPMLLASSIADVTITTDEPRVPVRHSGRLLYPVGTFRTTLCGPELALVNNDHEIDEIHSMATYQLGPVWKEFSRYWLTELDRLKASGPAWLRSAVKLMTNCTFGRIGSRSREWINVPGAKADHPWQTWWQRHPVAGSMVQWRALNGAVQYLDAGSEQPQSCPSISAWMCSLARVKLWSYLRYARFGGQVYYTDTDSLFVDQGAYDSLRSALCIGEEPGALTLKEESDDVWVFAPKHYCFGGRWCAAGVPRSARITHDGLASWYRVQHLHADLAHGFGFGGDVRSQQRKATKAKWPYEARADGTVPAVRMEYDQDKGVNRVT